MFSKNCPEPDAHWLVIRYESTFARPSMMTARACKAPTSTIARAPGHAVKVPGTKGRALPLAGRGHVRELLGLPSGFFESGAIKILGDEDRIAAPDPLAPPEDHARLGARSVLEQHDLDRRRSDVDARHAQRGHR
jgi:hypothetical protein